MGALGKKNEFKEIEKRLKGKGKTIKFKT